MVTNKEVGVYWLVLSFFFSMVGAALYPKKLLTEKAVVCKVTHHFPVMYQAQSTLIIQDTLTKKELEFNATKLTYLRLKDGDIARFMLTEAKLQDKEDTAGVLKVVSLLAWLFCFVFFLLFLTYIYLHFFSCKQ
jgi:hypothetical protein